MLSAGLGAGPAAIAQIGVAALRQGSAAEAAYAFPRAYQAYGQAATAADASAAVRRAASIAQIRVLTSLGAPTAARHRLLTLPPRPMSPAEQVARLTALAEVELRAAHPAPALAAARKAAHLLAAEPTLLSAQSVAWLLQVQAFNQLHQPDSGLQYALRVQSAIRLPQPAAATLDAEAMAVQAALLPIPSRTKAYRALALATSLRPTTPVTIAGQRFPTGGEAATLYYDSALVAERAATGPELGQSASLWRLQGLNWANRMGAVPEDDDAAFYAAAAAADRCLARAMALETDPMTRFMATMVRGEVQCAQGEPLVGLRLFGNAEQAIAPEAAWDDQRRYLLEQQARACRNEFEATGDRAYMLRYYTYANTLADLQATQRQRATLSATAPSTDPATLFDNYALAVEAGELLFRQSGDSTYLARAFAVAENAKAYRLLARLTLGSETAALRADPAILHDWRAAVATARRWQEAQAVVRHHPALHAAPGLEGAADSVRAAEAVLDRVIQRTRTRFPAFYARVFGGQYSLSLARVRALLPADGSVAAIEYLRRTSYEDGGATERLFAFVVERRGTHLLQLPLPRTFSASIDSLAVALARPGDPRFAGLAARLYQQVVAPVVGRLDSHVRRLVLAPDGELWRVPFEALLTARVPASAAQDFRRWPYLLHRYRIGYAHSLTLYGSIREVPASAAPSRMLALAPYTSSTGGSPLPFTARLLTTLRDQLAGEYRTDTAATPAAFRQLAARFDVLHLASHATPNLNDPLASRLLLAGGSLTLAELLGLNLHPRLVVLSACQTGVGRLTELSEGVSSLSWAFAGAGAAAQLATLWRVDDRTTAALLGDFYTDLRARHAKDVALAAAKHAWLRRAATPEEGHPFYWAGLVLTGDERPLQLARAAPPASVPQRSGWWLAGGLLAGSMAVAGWRRYRKAG